MTRPTKKTRKGPKKTELHDLAFAYSQLSKFVQYPGVVHLQAAEQVLQHVRDTYGQGLTYFDPGAETKNKVTSKAIPTHGNQ
jgi:hypothetical protein